MRSLALQLLSAWRAAGHAVGVDSYVRALELLGKLPANTAPEQFKTLLAPIFANDREQQAAFYLLFDRILPEWQRQQRAELRQRRRLRMGLGALLLAAALAGCWAYQKYSPINTAPPPPVESPGASPSDSLAQQANSIIDTILGPLLPPSRDTLPLKPFRHQPDISTLRLKEIPLLSRGHAYWDSNKSILAAVLAGLLLGIGLLRNRLRHRRLLRDIEAQRDLGTQATELKRNPSDKPPFVWQFQWKQPLELYADQDLADITPRLRSRSAGSDQRLDGPRTVQATVRNAGRISFRYRRPTQPDEHLLLIDLRSANDHRAQFFEAIYQHLRRNEVLVERYFYRHDPRFCWNEQPGSACTLQDLHQKHPAHRLLLLGSGSAFLSKTDGDWLPWASVLEQWRYRTLLSTVPTDRWSAEELRLAERFRIVPASLRGLADIADNAGVEEGNDLARWRKTSDEHADPIRLPEAAGAAATVALLEAEYTDDGPEGPDERLLCLLAATALSPVLHWDATRFFAEVVEQQAPRPNQPLLTPLTLQRLCRLPWFVQGRMPDNARRGLLQWLQTEQPLLLENLRGRWQQLLENQLETLRQQAAEQGQPPFEESVAYEQLRLTMLVNELALDDLRLQLPRSQRLQLERELQELSQHTEPDLVALELLENAKQREATGIGTDEEEMQPPPAPAWWSQWRWQLPGLLLAWLLLWGYNGNRRQTCNGTELRYQAAALCLAQPQDSLLYYEYLLCDTLDAAVSYWQSRMYVLEKHSPSERLGGFLPLDSTAGGGFLNVLLEIEGDSARASELDSLLWARGLKGSDPRIRGVADALKESQALLSKYELPTSSFYRNTATALWNAGAERYNRGQQDSACIFFRNLLRWPERDSALTAAELAFISGLCPEYGVPATAPRDTEYRYTATVTDAATGQALQAATLRPQNTGTNWQKGPGAGQFQLSLRLSGLPPTLRVLASCAGYVDSVFSVAPNAPATLRLRPAPRTPRAYVISGIVRTGSIPLAGVRVESPYGTARTGDNGAYLITLPASNAYPASLPMLFTKEGYYTEIASIALPRQGSGLSSAQVSTIALTAPPVSLAAEPSPSAQAVAAIPMPEMIPIPAGTFRMGSEDGTPDADNDEKPAHDVTLRAFSMGRTEVTNAQYAAFLNEKDNQEEGGVAWINLQGKFQSEKCRIQSADGRIFTVEKGYENHPVIYVSWYGARAYCAWLSQKTGQNYRLPTEAEWEYAARGGPKWTDGYKYAGSNNIDEVAWYTETTNDQGARPVAGKKANQLGLYDMSGNVWEWCEDDWHANYEGAPKDGSPWVGKGSQGDGRVLRGGSGLNDAQPCRVAYRGHDTSSNRFTALGFRLVRPF
jgi:formylglycine-generating enzyme required for sulfatase activity